jgi:hypothetical protein
MGSHALIFQLEFHGLGDVVIWCVWIIKLGPQVNSLSTSWACSKPSLLVSPPIQLALLCHPQRRWKLSRISNSNWIQRNLKKKNVGYYLWSFSDFIHDSTDIMLAELNAIFLHEFFLHVIIILFIIFLTRINRIKSIYFHKQNNIYQRVVLPCYARNSFYDISILSIILIYFRYSDLSLTFSNIKHSIKEKKKQIFLP